MEAFFASLGHHTNDTKEKGGLSSSEFVMKSLSGEEGKRNRKELLTHKILEIRKMRDVVSKYLTKIPRYVVDGRLRPTYSLHVTSTGRIACRNPNLQNIIKGSDVRSIFRAGKGRLLISRDYDRIELVMLAWLANEPIMLEAIAKGEDIHQTTADALGVTRSMAKTANFGIVYGQSIREFASTAGITDAEAAKFFKGFHNTFKAIKPYLESLDSIAHTGKAIVTPFGRHRIFEYSTRTYNRVQRQWRNYVLQSTASDICLHQGAILSKKLKERYGDKAFIVNIVHDDIIVECPRDDRMAVSNLMKKCMEDVSTLPFKLPVPIRTGEKIGKSWKDITD